MYTILGLVETGLGDWAPAGFAVHGDLPDALGDDAARVFDFDFVVRAFVFTGEVEDVPGFGDVGVDAKVSQSKRIPGNASKDCATAFCVLCGFAVRRISRIPIGDGKLREVCRVRIFARAGFAFDHGEVSFSLGDPFSSNRLHRAPCRVPLHRE